ncbi:MAG: hypothetical protein HYS35_09560 [Betaproteobacteria bacterium]|nr:hypothetical protein [Betaproteobacteria bacterium]
MRSIALIAAALVALAGCMEIEQTATPSRQGKYQGKPDSTPWSNQPLAAGPQWKQGDRASWEEQIKKRQLGQHEHRRIYQ